jgi:LPXTG-motif cell wall-anchored protein
VTPEACVATIDALPATGIDAGGMLAIGAGAVGVALLGAALLVIRRRRYAVMTAALTLLVLAGALAVVPAPPASAAGSVTYGEGCSLIAVSDVTVPPASVDGGLVPGDDVQIVSAVVANPTGAPIEITLRGSVGDRLAPVVAIRTTIDGAVDDVTTIAPGSRVTVGLVLGMATTVGNDAQGIRAGASLIVTAAQR